MSYSRTLSSPPVQGKPVFPATIDEYDVRTAKFVTYFVNQFVQKTLIPVNSNNHTTEVYRTLFWDAFCNPMTQKRFVFENILGKTLLIPVDETDQFIAFAMVVSMHLHFKPISKINPFADEAEFFKINMIKEYEKLIDIYWQLPQLYNQLDASKRYIDLIDSVSRFFEQFISGTMMLDSSDMYAPTSRIGQPPVPARTKKRVDYHPIKDVPRRYTQEYVNRLSRRQCLQLLALDHINWDLFDYVFESKQSQTIKAPDTIQTNDLKKMICQLKCDSEFVVKNALYSTTISGDVNDLDLHTLKRMVLSTGTKILNNKEITDLTNRVDLVTFLQKRHGENAILFRKSELESLDQETIKTLAKAYGIKYEADQRVKMIDLIFTANYTRKPMYGINVGKDNEISIFGKSESQNVPELREDFIDDRIMQFKTGNTAYTQQNIQALRQSTGSMAPRRKSPRSILRFAVENNNKNLAHLTMSYSPASVMILPRKQLKDLIRLLDPKIKTKEMKDDELRDVLISIWVKNNLSSDNVTSEKCREIVKTQKLLPNVQNVDLDNLPDENILAVCKMSGVLDKEEDGLPEFFHDFNRDPLTYQSLDKMSYDMLRDIARSFKLQVPEISNSEMKEHYIQTILQIQNEIKNKQTNQNKPVEIDPRDSGFAAENKFKYKTVEGQIKMTREVDKLNSYAVNLFTTNDKETFDDDFKPYVKEIADNFRGKIEEEDYDQRDFYIVFESKEMMKLFFAEFQKISLEGFPAQKPCDWQDTLSKLVSSDDELFSSFTLGQLEKIFENEEMLKKMLELKGLACSTDLMNFIKKKKKSNLTSGASSAQKQPSSATSPSLVSRMMSAIPSPFQQQSPQQPVTQQSPQQPVTQQSPQQPVTQQSPQQQSYPQQTTGLFSRATQAIANTFWKPSIQPPSISTQQPPPQPVTQQTPQQVLSQPQQTPPQPVTQTTTPQPVTQQVLSQPVTQTTTLTPPTQEQIRADKEKALRLIKKLKENQNESRFENLSDVIGFLKKAKNPNSFNLTGFYDDCVSLASMTEAALIKHDESMSGAPLWDTLFGQKVEQIPDVVISFIWIFMDFRGVMTPKRNALMREGFEKDDPYEFVVLMISATELNDEERNNNNSNLQLEIGTIVDICPQLFDDHARLLLVTRNVLDCLPSHLKNETSVEMLKTEYDQIISTISKDSFEFSYSLRIAANFSLKYANEENPYKQLIPILRAFGRKLLEGLRYQFIEYQPGFTVSSMFEDYKDDFNFHFVIICFAYMRIYDVFLPLTQNKESFFKMFVVNETHLNVAREKVRITLDKFQSLKKNEEEKYKMILFMNPFAWPTLARNSELFQRMKEENLKDYVGQNKQRLLNSSDPEMIKICRQYLSVDNRIKFILGWLNDNPEEFHFSVPSFFTQFFLSSEYTSNDYGYLISDFESIKKLRCVMGEFTTQNKNQCKEIFDDFMSFAKQEVKTIISMFICYCVINRYREDFYALYEFRGLNLIKKAKPMKPPKGVNVDFFLNCLPSEWRDIRAFFLSNVIRHTQKPKIVDLAWNRNVLKFLDELAPIRVFDSPFLQNLNLTDDQISNFNNTLNVHLTLNKKQLSLEEKRNLINTTRDFAENEKEVVNFDSSTYTIQERTLTLVVLNSILILNSVLQSTLMNLNDINYTQLYYNVEVFLHRIAVFFHIFRYATRFWKGYDFYERITIIDQTYKRWLFDNTQLILEFSDDSMVPIITKPSDISGLAVKWDPVRLFDPKIARQNGLELHISLLTFTNEFRENYSVFLIPMKCSKAQLSVWDEILMIISDLDGNNEEVVFFRISMLKAIEVIMMIGECTWRPSTYDNIQKIRLDLLGLLLSISSRARIESHIAYSLISLMDKEIGMSSPPFFITLSVPRARNFVDVKTSIEKNLIVLDGFKNQCDASRPAAPTDGQIVPSRRSSVASFHSASAETGQIVPSRRSSVASFHSASAETGQIVPSRRASVDSYHSASAETHPDGQIFPSRRASVASFHSASAETHPDDQRFPSRRVSLDGSQQSTPQQQFGVTPKAFARYVQTPPTPRASPEPLLARQLDFSSQTPPTPEEDKRPLTDFGPGTEFIKFQNSKDVLEFRKFASGTIRQLETNSRKMKENDKKLNEKMNEQEEHEHEENAKRLIREQKSIVEYLKGEYYAFTQGVKSKIASSPKMLFENETMLRNISIEFDDKRELENFSRNNEELLKQLRFNISEREKLENDLDLIKTKFPEDQLGAHEIENAIDLNEKSKNIISKMLFNNFVETTKIETKSSSPQALASRRPSQSSLTSSGPSSTPLSPQSTMQQNVTPSSFETSSASPLLARPVEFSRFTSSTPDSGMGSGSDFTSSPSMAANAPSLQSMTSPQALASRSVKLEQTTSTPQPSASELQLETEDISNFLGFTFKNDAEEQRFFNLHREDIEALKKDFYNDTTKRRLKAMYEDFKKIRFLESHGVSFDKNSDALKFYHGNLEIINNMETQLTKIRKLYESQTPGIPAHTQFSAQITLELGRLRQFANELLKKSEEFKLREYSSKMVTRSQLATLTAATLTAATAQPATLTAATAQPATLTAATAQPLHQNEYFKNLDDKRSFLLSEGITFENWNFDDIKVVIERNEKSIQTLRDINNEIQRLNEEMLWPGYNVKLSVAMHNQQAEKVTLINDLKRRFENFRRN